MPERVTTIDYVEARLKQLRQLRRLTASRSCKRHYTGAIAELELLLEQMRSQRERAQVTKGFE